MHEEIKDLTLDQVRAWDAQTFPELIEQLERLPEEAYADAAHFEHMPRGWAPCEGDRPGDYAIISDRPLRYAQIRIGALPILLWYAFW